MHLLLISPLPPCPCPLPFIPALQRVEWRTIATAKDLAPKTRQGVVDLDISREQYSTRSASTASRTCSTGCIGRPALPICSPGTACSAHWLAACWLHLAARLRTFLTAHPMKNQPALHFNCLQAARRRSQLLPSIPPGWHWGSWLAAGRRATCPPAPAWMTCQRSASWRATWSGASTRPACEFLAG